MVCNHSSVLHILIFQFRPRNVDFLAGIKYQIKSAKFAWYKMWKNLYTVAKNVIKRVPNVQRFGLLFFSVVNDERIVNENAKKTRVFYIFIRLSIKVWAFSKWSGSYVVLRNILQKTGNNWKRKLSELMNETNWAVSNRNECVQIVVNHALPFI